MAFLTAFITRQDHKSHKWPSSSEKGHIFIYQIIIMSLFMVYDDGPAVIKIPAENQFHVSCCVENDDFDMNKPE